MTEKQIKHKGVILSDKEVNQLLNEQDKRITELEQENKQLKQIREEQIETILKQKRKIKELEKCREELFIRERDTKNEWRELKERNQRQYDSLKKISDLMVERDWKSLEKMVEDWEEAEERLKREWGTYGE